MTPRPRLLCLFACSLLFACGKPAPFVCGGKAEVEIPQTRVCDGQIDCWGGQDERGDDCETELFFCDQPEPQAVLAELVCDGVEDCGDGYDEQGCEG